MPHEFVLAKKIDFFIQMKVILTLDKFISSEQFLEGVNKVTKGMKRAMFLHLCVQKKRSNKLSSKYYDR
jgi:hypothetical protein